MSIYYDNNDLSPAGTVDIDRVYCLRFNEFTEQHWATLGQIYTALPGWIGPGLDNCPCWFGASVGQPYIVASVEPSGLQITGTLPRGDFDRWHDTFLPRLTELPTFDVG